MDQLLDEAVDEATSGSPRRWALLLLMLVVGGILAVWLSKRARAGSDLDAAAELAGAAGGRAGGPLSGW